MPGSSRKFIAGIVIVLGGGALIGWLYGQVLWGLLISSLLVVGWQALQLLRFTQAIHTGDFEDFRIGEGIWQQMFARFSFERERATVAKREYRRLLKEIRKSTDAMPDGAVIFDENHEIVMCNRAAKYLAGFKRKKDRGQRVDNILRDPKLVKLLQSGEFAKEIEIPSPVRDDAWLNCRMVPYGANQTLLIIRDVTERFRLSRMRRDFVANASHELRSPLTVISGYLDSLADDAEISGDWSQPISQMQAQSRRMNHIISELLELSRLESAGRASTEEIVDVAGLLAAARKSYVGQGGTATIEVLAESAPQLLGRSTEIESLISNLLSNAVRHTPSSGLITLTWRADADGAELIVSDAGEGIPEEQIPRLTERFFRVDRGRAREDGGVGLGLAIVKHVLSRHDGSLSISSDIGEGSRFCCRFPVERVVAEPPVPIRSGGQGG
jgi:two-component system phosphate regulon sensor histidine kinase PhoR